MVPPLVRVLLAAQMRAHAGRALVGVAAIAIGVAMGYAVYLINHAALAEFSQAVRTLAGQADLEVRGPRSGFDENLYPRLAALPEVAAAVRSWRRNLRCRGVASPCNCWAWTCFGPGRSTRD